MTFMTSLWIEQEDEVLMNFWYQTRRLTSEITRTAVLYIHTFEVFIAHESNFTLISSFHITIETPTALCKETKPPLSYHDKNDILWVNCDSNNWIWANCHFLIQELPALYTIFVVMRKNYTCSFLWQCPDGWLPECGLVSLRAICWHRPNDRLPINETGTVTLWQYCIKLINDTGKSNKNANTILFPQWSLNLWFQVLQGYTRRQRIQPHTSKARW